jgi:adenylate kinase
MLNIVLFGPPGAGKGTQAVNLIEKYKLVHLSTGDILRGELAAKSPLGLEARKFMDKGELVPDEVVIGMIEFKLDQNANAKGFIFDGFPRTNAQANALDKLLDKKKTSITTMVALEVEKQELINRLMGRGKVSGRADDQDIDVIGNRINVYNRETAPVIDYYNKQGKFKSVNGMGTVEEIFGRLCSAIDKVDNSGCGCGCKG